MTIKWRGSSQESEVTRSTSETRPQAEVLPPVDNSVTILSTDESARDFVRDARTKMGMMARWNFDRQTQGELQRVAGEIAVNYLNAQKEIMINKVISGVALAKRDTLAEFLRAAVVQDQNLLKMTNDAQKQMVNMIEDDVTVVLKEKKVRFDKAKADFDRGELLAEDYEGLKDVHTQAAQQLINDKFERMNKIAQSYLEHFDQALRQYRERAIEAGVM